MSKTVKVTFELPEVKGYEYTGEYGSPCAGEFYLDVEDGVKKATYNMRGEYPIMRPIASWRDAKPSDLENGPVECRYKDGHQDPWMEGYFTAYSAGEDDDLRFGVGDDTASLDGWYAYCQVKDNA